MLYSVEYLSQDYKLLCELVLSHVSDLVIILSPTLHVVACNNAAKNIFSWQRIEDISYDTLPNILAQHNIAMPALSDIDATESNSSKEQVKYFSSFVGQQPIAWTAQITTTFILLVGKNMADIVAANNKANQLKHIIENSPDIIFWKDRNSVYLGCNKHFARFNGFAKCDDIVGKTDFDIYWKDQAECFIKDDREVIATATAKLNLEESVPLENGNVLTLITNKVPLTDLDGRVIGVFGISTDITLHKQKEVQLYNLVKKKILSRTERLQLLRVISKEIIGVNAAPGNKFKNYSETLIYFLKGMIDNLPGYIYWKDIDSVYMGCNYRFATMVGLSSKEKIIGKQDSFFEKKLKWQSGTAKRLRENDLEVMSNRESKTFEEVFDRQSAKEMTMLMTKIPIFNQYNEVIGVFAVSLDITEYKRVSIEKSNFIANMSHDIRTPLTGIIGVAEELLKEKLTDKQAEYINQMMSSSYQLLELFNEIIELVQLESGSLPIASKQISLHKIIKSGIELLQPAAVKKHLELQMHYDANIPQWLLGDSIRLHRILLNLLSNAIKFTNQGYVKVSVTLAKMVDDKAIIKLIIQDSGIGIPPDKRHIIFEKFYRLHPAYAGIYKGIGLGLSIVKQFIDELQGEIYVDSAINQGTTFVCVVPFKKPLLDDILISQCNEQLDIMRAPVASIQSEIVPKILRQQFSECVLENVKNFNPAA